MAQSAPAEGPAPKPSRPLPMFFKDVRYVVKSFLGEGATKKVYLLNDTLLDHYPEERTEALERDLSRREILRS